MNNTFKVRVYVNGSAPVVLRGGTDAFGLHIKLREASGEGREATPAKLLSVKPADLRPLPSGEDADFEYLIPVPSKGL